MVRRATKPSGELADFSQVRADFSRFLKVVSLSLSRSRSLTDSTSTLNGEPLWHTSVPAATEQSESKKATKGLKRANKAFSHGRRPSLWIDTHIVRSVSPKVNSLHFSHRDEEAPHSRIYEENIKVVSVHSKSINLQRNLIFLMGSYKKNLSFSVSTTQKIVVVNE